MEGEQHRLLETDKGQYKFNCQEMYKDTLSKWLGLRAPSYKPFGPNSDSLDVIWKRWQEGYAADKAESGVSVSVCVYSISNINVAASSFDCDFGVKLVWQDEALDKLSDKEYEKVKFDQHPQFDILNASGSLEELTNSCRASRWPIPGQTSFLYNHFTRCYGALRCLYAIRLFPFDSDILPIEIRLLDSSKDLRPMPYVEMKLLCRQPSFTVHEPIQAHIRSPENKPEFVLGVVIRRKWEYYWWNVIFPQWVVTTLSFTSFAMSPTDDGFGDRSGTALTLILTSIAFKTYLSSSLPACSYVTMLDMYMIGSFVMQTLVFALQGMPLMLIKEGFLHWDDEDLAWMDRTNFWVSAGLWLIFNIVMHVQFAWCRYGAHAIIPGKALFKDWEGQLVEADDQSDSD